MLTMNVKLIQAAILLVYFSQVFSIQTIYLDESCKSQKLQYVDPQLRIKASRYASLNRHLNCSLVVRAKPLDQLVAVVRSVDFSCYSMDVRAYDGESRNVFIQKMCGYSIYGLNKRTFTSNRNALVFDLTTVDPTSGGIDIIVTSYNSGTCSSFEYECSNGRCIDDGLTCNGYNNCGDNSDELAPCAGGLVLGAGIIVAIVLGGLIVVVVIPIALICSLIRYRSRSYGRF